MKLIQKIAAGIFLTIGVSFSLVCLIPFFNPEASAEDKEAGFAAFAVIGLPPTIAGGVLIWNLRRQHRQNLQKLLLEQERLFIELINQQEGKITVIEFATAAQISLEEAKMYLEQKSKELNANFEATDSGAMVYLFPIR